MAKNVGWVKLFRKLIDNRIYFGEPFDKTHAWIDLILIADKDGTVSLTVKQLADRWQWSPNKVRRYIDALAKEDMLRIDGTFVGTKGGTILTLVKYKDYQVGRQNDGTIDGINGGTIQWGKGDLYNKYISRREEEKNTPNILTDITPKGESAKQKKAKPEPYKIPTIEEVEAYCKERNNGIDPVYWWHYQDARGWEYKKGVKIKNWKSAVITWERNKMQNKSSVEKPKVVNDDLKDIFG